MAAQQEGTYYSTEAATALKEARERANSEGNPNQEYANGAVDFVSNDNTEVNSLPEYYTVSTRYRKQ